ncbi:MAG: TIGR02099 family protein [Gammaproteobacteria bacterium]|nr:TIGR02099 family protein [Gammaproteobacteria bacterium]NNL49316.1 TIGR02099 family protein [Woeseiaceae bacterium]
MKAFLQRLFKFAAYTAAGVVIMLAIAVGLFRLFLPRLPQYQEDIKDWASAAIGMEVEFSGMDARWGLSGPELEFYDAELYRASTQTRVIAADRVRVSVALTRLLFEEELAIDRIVVSETSIEVRQLDDGRWWVQGAPADELLGKRTGGDGRLPEIEVIGEDVEILLLQPGDARPRYFALPGVTVSIDENRIAFDADVRLPDELGRQLSASATQLLTLPQEARQWNVIIEADDINLGGWSDLRLAGDRGVLSGTGDVALSVSYARGRVRNASADVDFANVELEQGELFDLGGRFELNVADDGWLIAAERFQITRADRQWPEASLRAEVSTDDDGQLLMMDVRASYLDLQDAGLFMSVLGAEQQQQVATLGPSGVVRDLIATVSDIDSESPRFDVAARLENCGMAADGKRPGVRGFSGVVRANRLGGSVEIRSADMIVDAPEFLSEPIDIVSAEGIVIWRSTDRSTTVVSDSIRLRNDIFDSQSNVQVIIDAEGSSPVVDLDSTWSVSNVAAMKRYIPQKIIKPKLYDWLQMALVKGSIPTGTTSLNGPLDKFPYDDGDGRFLVEAAVRNLTFKYHPRWPAAVQSDMDVVLDKMRLYSVRNRSFSAGNQTVDAKIEIAELRDPVLTIGAFSTGTLETIRSFSAQSPIADVFGGQLDRISVSGEASYTLDLKVPLKNSKQFEFTSRVRSNNGTIALKGFKPPLTDLIGEVTITRDTISSASLGGRFLGEEVAIDLATSDDPQFSVIASTAGSVTSGAIVADLGLPLQGLISGFTNYEARILFPRGKQATPSPLTIQIDSELDGLGLDLPEPVGKPADTPMQIRGDIRFLPGGKKIESAGVADNDIAWQVGFRRSNDAWDFDRGVLALGSDPIQPAETRGLHIRGTTSTVRLDDWLNLSRSGDREIGTADRIRSIDLVIADLFAIGQHLEGHHVRVDRSARDWLVQVDGDNVVGSLFVPYDFTSERAMVLEMTRLQLPGDEESPDEVSKPDPRKLPPITLTAEEFALGDRQLGAVELRLVRVEGGLEATTMTTTDDTFEISGTGRWVVDESDPLGSRTSTTATLTSTNVMQTMSRLNFTPGIASDQMSASVNLSWSGGPRADFLDVLDGEVSVQFGNGQLEEVEPGAGRIFGLMSIVALPRRLSLDFRDVFSKGFGFDKIAGTFRIVDGESYTCDLSLEGPAADIGIVGRTGLATRDYDQAAIISANFGNTLPIVGAVVAGPQVAAALLIFSQIFKKPLQEVGQVYYGISGSWDEPVVDSTNAATFASRGELAGCVPATD